MVTRCKVQGAAGKQGVGRFERKVQARWKVTDGRSVAVQVCKCACTLLPGTRPVRLRMSEGMSG